MRPGAALYCKSNFSFLEGASHPEELVEEAARAGFTALTLCDRDGVYGIVRAHVRARELGVQLIVGSELTLEDESTIVLLAKTRAGYASLCRLISKGRRRHEKGRCRLRWDEVSEHAEGLVALWGGDRSLLVGEAEPDEVAQRLQQAFGSSLFALCTRHKRHSEAAEEARLRARAARYGIPRVAAVEVLYHTPSRRPLQDVLTCIRHGVTLTHARTLLKPNAEHGLKSPEVLAALFADDREALENIDVVRKQCAFSMSEIRYRYPSERLPNGMSSSEWLRELVTQGAHVRYGAVVPVSVLEQIDKELDVIDRLDYCGYFLTMYEVVQFCRKNAILCQGRGSAANSIVCFCLGITAVGPPRIDLLFERFLSVERAEPPDIDLDIEHSRREEVIQHVYAKYSRNHAAMVANVIRYRGRSALRDVGKALGLAATSLDRLSKLLSHWDKGDAQLLRTAGLDPEAPIHARLLALSEEIQGFPRHLSIHPGGFLLGHEPVHDLVPIENGAMEGRTVIQWDKDDVEALGLFKVDLLGLGALTQLRMAFDLLAQRGVELSMASIPDDDPKTYAMIQRADTVGVFQIESRAQMAMLPRLLPKSFYDLVIEVSIVRPGPITGGMVHPYLRRRSGQEQVSYPHELLRPVLEKTLGIPLFQEQVMRLAVVAADYTPGEADGLRRDMAAWRRSGRIEAHRERLITRMKAKGIDAEFAERVFSQIKGFGEYGFPESHAASFALIAYATSYVRAHHPAEFTCSLLNAQPMGFYSPATIIDDAKRHGVVVRPIDVNESRDECTLESSVEERAPRAVRMGLRYVKGLSEAERKSVVDARSERAFGSLEDFVRRTEISADAASALAEAGAYQCLGLSRRHALWEVRGLLRDRKAKLPVSLEKKRARFAGLTPIEQIVWDYRTTRHSSRAHPLALVRERLRRQGLPSASELMSFRHGERIRFAGLVICRQRPGTASGVTFMTLEDETGFANLVLWKRVFVEHLVLARTCSFLGVTGTLQKQDDVVHLVAESLWAPDTSMLEVGSRDFH